MTNVLRPLPVDEFVRLAEQSGLEVSRDDLDNLARRRLLQPFESGSYSRLHLYSLAVYFDAIRVFRHPWSLRTSGRTLDAVKSMSESVHRLAVDLEDDGHVDGLGQDIAQLALDIERFIAAIDPFGPIADVIDVVRSDVLDQLRGTGRLYAELRATASSLAVRSEELDALDSRGPQTREVPEDVLKETAEQYPLGDLSDLTDGFEDETGFEALEVRGPLTREIQLASEADDDLDELSEPEAVELDLDSEADDTGEMDVSEESADEDSDAEAGEQESDADEDELEDSAEPEPEQQEENVREEDEEEEADVPEEEEEEQEEEEEEEDVPKEEEEEEDVREEEEEEEDGPEENEEEEPQEDVETLDDADLIEAASNDDFDDELGDGLYEEVSEISEGEEDEVESPDDEVENDQDDADEEDAPAGEDSADEIEDDPEEEEEEEVEEEEEEEEHESEEEEDSADDADTDSGDDLRTTVETEAAREANDNPFSREDSMSRTGRTKALLDRLEEIKAQKEEPEDGAPADASLEAKVNELNQKREQLIRAQDWAGLVTLYETRIDLFEEPTDRQQVFLTLATLYELKLADHASSFEAFSAAFDIDVHNGRIKTLDSLRKIGRSADVVEKYVGWLEARLGVEDDELRHIMQRDLSEAHRTAGHPQRGFLSFAAYIAENPDRATPDALDFLDEMSISVGDDELAAFYEDILEHEASAETRALIGHRAGMFFQSCNKPEEAIRSFEVAFEADATSELAYSNLSRLYEKHERWADLRSLIAERLKSAEGDEAARLRKELGRVVQHETSTADAVEQFAETLDNDPNDDTALERLVAGYAAQSKFTDSYAHLNRLLDKSPDPAQEVRIRRHLAELAMNHLESPEEASHHLETALTLGGPNREILELLASVRLSAGDWSEAISTVRLLTGGTVTLPDASLRKWLNAGIEAARMAERPDDMRHFQEHLQKESGA